jgi:galactokinase
MQQDLIEHFRSRFGRSPEFLAWAPGRVEFIGNHTDYNGGTVLGAAIDRGVWVALAPREDNRRRMTTTLGGALLEFSAEPPVRQGGTAAWTNYPLGVLAVMPEFGLRVPAGFDLAVGSNLPAGAGLSSSAALELASALVYLAATGQEPTRETVVKLARRAENAFVGVPCGILDQAVVGFGRAGHLVRVDCRGPRFEPVPIPAEARFWVFNTHTKHALVDGMYAARHRECLAAARAAGVAFLADLNAAELQARADRLSEVELRRARHVVGEIERVARMTVALRAGDLAAAGELLSASHESSRASFENSTPELDFLVDRLRVVPEVFGARLTGGGFGGAVMALTDRRFGSEAAQAVSAAYAARFGSAPEVLPMTTGEGAGLLRV